MFNRPTKLFGITVHHEFASFFVFEKILNEFGPFDNIIELGTAGGGLSSFLDTQQKVRGGKFITYDIWPRPTKHTDNDPKNIFQRLNVEYRCQDIFSAEATTYISDRIASNTKTLIYCDNGNKPLEFQTFAPMIKQGSVIGVDDWDVDISGKDVVHTIEKCGLEEILHDDCFYYSKRMKFWVKK